MRYKSKVLTEEQVIEIEQSKLSYRVLADKYKVSKQTIVLIKKASNTQNPKAKPASNIVKFFRRVKRAFRFIFSDKDAI